MLLQREIPDSVNLQVATIASASGVRVLLDVGGSNEEPLSDELLSKISYLSPNETELARITDMPTETQDEVIAACQKLLTKGMDGVLAKLGARGSLLVTKDGSVHLQPAIEPPSPIVDTTGAGDAFTGGFVVGLAEGKSLQDAMTLGSAAASLSLTAKGAMGSFPKRPAVDELVAYFNYSKSV